MNIFELTPEQLSNISLGLLVIVTTVLGFIGSRFGRKARDTPAETLELAGAIIDSSKADEMILALDRTRHALDKNTAAVGEMRQDTSEVRQAIVNLTSELIRGGRR